MYCPFKLINGTKDVDCVKERCEWYNEAKKKCAVLQISIDLEKIFQEVKDNSYV